MGARNFASTELLHSPAVTSRSPQGQVRCGLRVALELDGTT